MALGFIREVTHREVVARLELRIHHLETQLSTLQMVAGTQRCAVSIPTQSSEVESVTTKVGSSPTQGSVGFIKSGSKSRIVVLRDVLPGVKFLRQGNKIMVKLDGRQVRVRLSQASDYNGVCSRFSFMNTRQGDICVSVNEDYSLRSVFIANEDMITGSGRIYIFADSDEDLTLIQNTSKVIRNIK